MTRLKARIGWPADGRGLLTKSGEYIALGLLIVAVSIINVLWIGQDTRPQPANDPNVYLFKTFEFIDRLGEQGGAQLWQSIAKMSLSGRPPLYQVLSVPFVFLFGRSQDAFLSINVIFGVILLLSTYGMGRLAKNGKTGLLAAFLVATYPPIINLSKTILPHFANSACVALSVWLLLLLLKTRSVKIAWLFGVSLGFGLLIHIDFFFVLAAPTVIFGFYILLFQTAPRYPPSLKAAPRWLLAKLSDPFVLHGLLPAGLIAIALAASWYWPQRQAAVANVQGQLQTASNEATYGFPGVPRSFWWYALTAPGAISTVLAVLLGIGLVVGTVRWQLSTAVLMVTFLTGYTGHALTVAGIGWFHFGSMLPVAAALTAVGVFELRNLVLPSRAGASRIGQLLSTVLLLVCTGVAAFNFSVVTWGVKPWSRPIAMALGAPLDSPTCLGSYRRYYVAFCPNPAREEDWHVSDILQVILDDPGCQGRQCHLVVVPRLDTFERSIFDYYVVRDSPQSRSRIAVSRADWVHGGDSYNILWLTSDYLVYIPELPSGKELLVALTRFLESPPALFADAHAEIVAFPLPGGWTAKLVRRTEPLRLEEASLSIAALEIPEEGKAIMLRKVQDQIPAEAVTEGQQGSATEPRSQAAHPSPRGAHWSLGSSLDAIRAYSDDTELIRLPDGAWAKPPPYDQDVLMRPSTLSVAGVIRSEQVHLHPFSADQNTYVRFDVKDCRYDTLQIGYGLADQVAGLSNGVRYTLQASVDRGDSYTVLWDDTVTHSVWQSQTLSLAAYRGKDVTLQLTVDAIGSYDYDWLQTTVRLLPALEE